MQHRGLLSELPLSVKLGCEVTNTLVGGAEPDAADLSRIAHLVSHGLFEDANLQCQNSSSKFLTQLSRTGLCRVQAGDVEYAAVGPSRNG